MRLKYKLALGSMLLMGSGVLGISMFSFRLIKRVRQGELESKGAVLLRRFTEQYAEAIQKNDEATLLKGFLDVAKDPEVVYGAALDMNGKVISDTNIKRVGRVDPDVVRLLQRSHAFYVMQDRTGDMLDMAMMARVKAQTQTAESFFLSNPGSPGSGAGEEAGVVRIGLSKKASAHFIENVRRGMATFLAGALALTLVFSLTFAWMISEPMAALLLAIEEIGKGNLDHAVEVDSRDEIGQVARAFNGMTADLRRRTSDLKDANLALTSTIDKLKEAGEAKSQFVSMVSHELRTPVAIILGYTDFTIQHADDMDGPTVLRYLKTIREGTLRLSRLVGDILDMSRIQRNELVLARVPFDLKRLIEAVVADLKLVHADMKFEIALDGGDWEVVSDRDRVQQVLINLLGNALKYSPKETVVRVEARREGEEIRVGVVDRGPGIAEGDREKIFQAFYRTPDAINMRSPGTGLGLTIAKAIVGALGGRIELISELGKGSTFCFTLPRDGARPQA